MLSFLALHNDETILSFTKYETKNKGRTVEDQIHYLSEIIKETNS